MANGEEEIMMSGSVSNAIRMLNRKIDRVLESVQAWPDKCAQHRIDLVERIAASKEVLGLPEKPAPRRNGNGKTFTILGVKIEARTLLVALVLAGFMLGPAVGGIAIFLARYGKKLAEVFAG